VLWVAMDCFECLCPLLISPCPPCQPLFLFALVEIGPTLVGVIPVQVEVGNVQEDSWVSFV